jgi:hypothetical protein
MLAVFIFSLAGLASWPLPATTVLLPRKEKGDTTAEILHEHEGVSVRFYLPPYKKN